MSERGPEDMTRRQFLRRTAEVTAGALAANLVPNEIEASANDGKQPFGMETIPFNDRGPMKMWTELWLGMTADKKQLAACESGLPCSAAATKMKEILDELK